MATTFPLLAPRPSSRSPWSVALALGLAATSVSASARAERSSAPVEQGYASGEVQHPAAVALGGAVNALGVSTTALYYNPANLTLARVYHVEGIGQIGLEGKRQSFGAAAVDSMTNRLAGGIAFNWTSLDPDGVRRQANDVRLGLAYPLGDKLSMGVTGRWLRVSQGSSAGPLGASYASAGTADQPLLNTVTFDAGLTLLPTDGLRIAVVGHNLSLPGALAPTLLAGGISYQAGDFSGEIGMQADFTTFASTRLRFMAGGEAFLADHVPLRIGYRYDDGTRAHAISGGIGYVDKRWSIEFGIRRDVSAPTPQTMLSGGLRIFFDSGKGYGDTPDTM